MSKFTQHLKTVLAFLARKWQLILGICAVVFVFSTLRACQDMGRLREAVERNPPLPKKQARAIKRKAAQDSTKAVVYQRIAIQAIKQARKDSTRAVVAEIQADSIKTVYDTFPSSSTSPLPDVQRRLNTYLSPDTSTF